MHKAAILACLLALSDFGASAHASLRAGVPSFSDADRAAVLRSTLLSEIISQNPWLVRQILDLLDLKATETSSRNMDLQCVTDWEIGSAVDARSAESSLEMIALLKQARKERDAKPSKPLPKSAPDASSRSALGSLEMIKMVKDAKEKKAAEVAK